MKNLILAVVLALGFSTTEVFAIKIKSSDRATSDAHAIRGVYNYEELLRDFKA